MPLRKRRVVIPRDMAARVQFSSDRTCCVCREREKPIVVHHIDDNPANNEPKNLAVLCFECHNGTQVQGGFGRKLDADLVTLYRDDWQRIVADGRAASASETARETSTETQVELTTSLAEIYREREDYFELALLYDSIRNVELRDKYIELALADNKEDWREFFLRVHVQKRPDLMAGDAIERLLASEDNVFSHEQRARALVDLGRYPEAAEGYVRGILQSLQDGSSFAAAFYLKELAKSEVTTELLQQALREATEHGDLWWQIRALQELGWTEELKVRLVDNAAEIESSANPLMLSLLAWARGDRDAYIKWRKVGAQWGASDRLDESDYSSPIDRVYFVVSSREGSASLAIDHPAVRQTLILPVYPNEAVSEALPLLEAAFAHYASQWRKIMVADPLETDARGFWIPAAQLPGLIAQPTQKAALDNIATAHLTDTERSFFAGMLPVPALSIDVDPELVGLSNLADVCEEPSAYRVDPLA